MEGDRNKMNIREELRERIADAERDATQSEKAAMNSYGAGFDRGYAEALKELLAAIEQEEG